MKISSTCDVEIRAKSSSFSAQLHGKSRPTWKCAHCFRKGCDSDSCCLTRLSLTARWRASSPSASCIITVALWPSNLWLVHRPTRECTASLKGDPIRPEGGHDYMRPSSALRPIAMATRRLWVESLQASVWDVSQGHFSELAVWIHKDVRVAHEAFKGCV